MSWSRTAVCALTGTLTRPKLMEPRHTGRPMASVYPQAPAISRRRPRRARPRARSRRRRRQRWPCPARPAPPPGRPRPTPAAARALSTAAVAFSTSASARRRADTAARCSRLASASAALRRSCSARSGPAGAGGTLGGRRLRRRSTSSPGAVAGRAAGSRPPNRSFGAVSPEPRIPTRSCATATSFVATWDSRAVISPVTGWRPTAVSAASARRTMLGAALAQGPSAPRGCRVRRVPRWPPTGPRARPPRHRRSPSPRRRPAAATAFSAQSSHPGRRSAASAVASSRRLSRRRPLTSSLRAATKSGGGVA